MKLPKIIIKTITTFFFIGYLPLIPGTFGSIAGVILFYLFKHNLTTYFLVTGLVILLGFILATDAEKIFNRKDARFIVIDEVSGMLLSLLFLPYDLKLVIIAFFLFRLLDTLKPFPANRLQDLKGGFGVMSDDIVAGLYTNIILQIVVRFVSFNTS